MRSFSSFSLAGIALAAALVSTGAFAQEAAIRKNLAERMPALPKIDEVKATPMKGLYEVRIGSDVLYTDEQANYLIQGALVDTKAGRNLTQERMEELTAINFKDLPTKNAITMVRGNGKRKIAVFEDPNCIYCKKFEAELQKVDNVTIYTYLIPILGQDSVTKTRDVWCAKDSGKVWTDWMRNSKTPATAKCDTSAIDANLAISRKHQITGTPTVIFENGKRVPGMIPAEQLEKLLAEASK